MRKLWLAAGLWLVAGAAAAQTPMALCVQSLVPGGTPNCIPISSTNPLPVTGTGSVPLGATTTQTGGTTSATPNAFTTAAAANPSRKGCSIQNTSASGTLYVFFGSGTATTAASFTTGPGLTIGCNPSGIVLTDQIQVAGSVASMTYALGLQ